MEEFERQLTEKNARLLELYEQHLIDLRWIQEQMRADPERRDDDVDLVDDPRYIFRMLRRHDFAREPALHGLRTAVQLEREVAPVASSSSPLVEILPRSSGTHLVCTASLSAISSSTPDDLKSAILAACHDIRAELAQRGQLQFVLLLDVRGAVPAPALAYELVPWYVRDAHPRFPGMCAAVLVRGYGWAHAGVWAVVRRLLPASAVTRVLFPTAAELAAFLARPAAPPPSAPPTTEPAPPSPVSPLAPRSHHNPTYGYRPGGARRRKRDLARTLAHLWLARWRTRAAAWGVFGLIWALLVFSRRWRV